MNSTIPVSVFIICHNEEQHIARAIKSCQDFDEVIVVDSGSTDSTVAIAKSLGARVVHNEWPGYAKQKQFAMSLCKHEWVLNLDADEELTPALIQDFKRLIASDRYDYIKCYRNDYFISGFFPRWIHLPNNHRIFKKSCAQYRLNDLVHEGPDLNGREGQSKHYFLHYGYASVETLSRKYDTYSSLKAQEKFAKGKKPSALKLLLIAPLEFIRVYVIYRYCLAGLRGFIFAKLAAHYAFLKEAKLYSYYRNSQRVDSND